MTSDDTDAQTRAVLAARSNFGLAPEQLHIVKQGKVPCLADGAARLALEPTDGHQLLTKPHGHGDIHALLHASGLARTLLAAGCTHLVFLQDTNALVFGGIPAALGLSAPPRSPASIPRSPPGAPYAPRSLAPTVTVTVLLARRQTLRPSPCKNRNQRAGDPRHHTY